MANLIPLTDDDIITAIRIYRSARVGPSNFMALLASSESFGAAWESLKKAYKSRKIEANMLCDAETAEREYDTGIETNANFLFKGDNTYPEFLAELETAPPFLWAKGNIDLLQQPNIAIVGARNASIIGVRTALHYGRELSQGGIVVTSGLARGVDAAAHEGALLNGTIGVTAGGLDIFYPRQNKALQENMLERGLVVSEMPFGHQPQAKNFPQRNRIIAGLARATLVIEATERSGTMITADDAMRFGREIMAVPGHPQEARAGGPNQLIQNGARLITSPQQILDFYGIHNAPAIPSPKPEQTLSTPSAISKFARQGLDEIEGNVVRAHDGETVRIK